MLNHTFKLEDVRSYKACLPTIGRFTSKLKQRFPDTDPEDSTWSIGDAVNLDIDFAFAALELINDKYKLIELVLPSVCRTVYSVDPWHSSMDVRPELEKFMSWFGGDNSIDLVDITNRTGYSRHMADYDTRIHSAACAVHYLAWLARGELEKAAHVLYVCGYSGFRENYIDEAKEQAQQVTEIKLMFLPTWL